MKFKSYVNPPAKHEFAEGGFKETIDVYEDIVNSKTGKLETKKTKQENFYQKIQSMKETQQLENIIKRYNIDLNENHITEISQEIVDMTNLPQDLIETYAVTKKLESMFNETTAEIKNHFKDFAGFLKSFQNGTLASDLKALSTRKTTEPVQPVQQPTGQTPVQPVQKTTEPAQTQGGIIYG